VRKLVVDPAWLEQPGSERLTPKPAPPIAPTPPPAPQRPTPDPTRPMPKTDGRPRVVVANRSDGGLLFWLAKLYGFAALSLLALFGLSGFLVYSYFSINAPPLPDFRNYSKAAPSVSRIYAADGTVLGEFAKEWREIVPLEQIPKQLVDAFLAV